MLIILFSKKKKAYFHIQSEQNFRIWRTEVEWKKLRQSDFCS